MPDDPFARAVARADADERARKAARREELEERWSSGNRTAFRTHLTVFIAINLLLFAIWATTTGTDSYMWPLWVFLAWGAGLGAHWAAVANHLGRSGRQRRGVEPTYAAPVAPPAPPAPAVAPVAPAPAATAAGAPSTAEELGRLAELHRAGALSDEEFSQAKARLLS